MRSHAHIQKETEMGRQRGMHQPHSLDIVVCFSNMLLLIFKTTQLCFMPLCARLCAALLWFWVASPVEMVLMTHFDLHMYAAAQLSFNRGEYCLKCHCEEI